MCALKATHAVVDAERLAALAELAYGASHEINNPLANISARAQALVRDEPDPERRRALEAIHQQALRAHEMISDLMLFARPPTLVLGEIRLGPLVRELVERMRPAARERAVRLDIDAPADGPLTSADSDQLSEAVRALLANAIEVSSPEGIVRVTVRSGTPKNGRDSGAEISVADSGPGLDPRVREHAFDPFFSGREAGRGLGFGLPKCWRIVTAHGGAVSLVAGEQEGAVATIWLPDGATDG